MSSAADGDWKRESSCAAVFGIALIAHAAKPAIETKKNAQPSVRNGAVSKDVA